MAGEKTSLVNGIVLMGVSGCGKTTVGIILAKKLGWQFIESDTYHTRESIHKMASGTPLNDKDRQPWLEALHEQMVSQFQKKEPFILACSALKGSYRKTLMGNLPGIEFVFMKGSHKLIFKRMQNRDHFMKADMLQSQFEALEEPADALTVDIQQSPEDLAQTIAGFFGLAS